MSPITIEMNGISSPNTSSGNSSKNHEENEVVSEMGVYTSSDDGAGDAGGPTTSTPIGDGSFDATEQPTSSTENCYGSVPKYGTLIPNRVFVGGISCHTTESELLQLFSKFGCVRGTKIIMDRTGVSKGYGFVTFETEEEAKRLFNAMNNRELPPIVHRDRRLNIAPAVKKQVGTFNNTTIRHALYGSSGSSVGTSSTFSPPPYDAYFYGQPPGDMYASGIPLQDTFMGSGFSMMPQSGPYYTALPNLGVGQTVPGPNGTLIYVPLMNHLPFQQIGTPEHWNGIFGLPTMGLQPAQQFTSCNSTGGSSAGNNATQFQDLVGANGGNAGYHPQDQMYYFGSSLITSPH